MEIEIAAKGRKGGGGGGEGKGRGSGGLSEATLLFLAKNRHQRTQLFAEIFPAYQAGVQTCDLGIVDVCFSSVPQV